MADYKTATIRNVAFLGHGGNGKTTLAESLLFVSNALDRQGKIEDGTTVSDYEPEEIKRKISISAAIAPVEWKQNKINIIDVPGYFDFVGESVGALRVCTTAAIVMSAPNGIEVGTEKAWEAAENNGKIIIVNQMDKEHADFDKCVEDLRAMFGSSVVPIILPIGAGNEFSGVVDLLHNKAYKVNGKKREEIEFPIDMQERMNAIKEEITEAVASTSEDLMEKYFEEGELSGEEITNGIKHGMLDGTIVPVVPCSAITGVGLQTLLDILVKYMPSSAGKEFEGVNEKGEPTSRKCDPDAPTSVFIFKTIADPFVGKLSLFKVMSGKVTGNTTLYNANVGKSEKITSIFTLLGKKQKNVQELYAGDIGAFSKLQFSGTGDTLCEEGNIIKYPELIFPEPCYSRAVYTTKQGDEDKVFGGLYKLADEDKTINIEKNTETTETIISGQGSMHLDVIKQRLKDKFGVDANFTEPKIPYRESIRKTVSCQGRHKKQSGGHGQFGDVWIEFSPLEDRSIDLEFEDAVVGGAVPRNFIPSVEKGLRENIKHGVLAGYPMYGLKAKLYDGSYHPVDSSEMAFKTAARIAYKKGCKDASPVILEPVMSVTILVPNDYTGDVMGDLNKRRGRIMGMNQLHNKQELIAEVPLAEMSQYATDLRSMTQARGSFSMKFERYEEVPQNEAQKIIDAAVLEEEEE
ncbi:MAG: elongation factor G [Eubacteriales bacterium]|nr:elongation factor G [Eubacteriales bacterium]